MAVGVDIRHPHRRRVRVLRIREAERAEELERQTLSPRRRPRACTRATPPDPVATVQHPLHARRRLQHPNPWRNAGLPGHRCTVARESPGVVRVSANRSCNSSPSAATIASMLQPAKQWSSTRPSSPTPIERLACRSSWAGQHATQPSPALLSFLTRERMLSSAIIDVRWIARHFAVARRRQYRSDADRWPVALRRLALTFEVQLEFLRINPDA